MEQAVYIPFTICLKWIIKVFKCFPCPFTVFNKTFKRFTYPFKKIGIHLMIWPNRSNSLPIQITCIRLTFLTKQACKENSPEKHPLNTIAHAVIEWLCCCPLQLTIFNSLSLSTKLVAILRICLSVSYHKIPFDKRIRKSLHKNYYTFLYEIEWLTRTGKWPTHPFEWVEINM